MSLLGDIAEETGVVTSKVLIEGAEVSTLYDILSIAVTDIFTGNSLYAASKSAVATMMKVLREELRADEVDVVNVYPGATSTDLWPDDLRKEHEHKMMIPDDVAAALLPAIEAISEGRMTVEEIVLRPKQGNI